MRGSINRAWNDRDVEWRIKGALTTTTNGRTNDDFGDRNGIGDERNAAIDDLRNGLFKLGARFNPSYDSSRKSINSRAPLRNSGLEFFE